MGLLEKFDKIEVKVDSRISDYDRRFCQAHQTAYEKARAFLEKMADEVDQAQNEQRALLKPYNEHDYTFISMGRSYSNDLNSDNFLNELDKTHACLIARVVSYFKNRYNVTLDDEPICKNLIPQKPEEPHYYGWRRTMTEEEEREIDQRAEAYKVAYGEYIDKLRTLSISYEDILDQIFIQLDGYSFSEKAVMELKHAAHKHAWNTYHGTKSYEIKKAVISFTSSCSYYSYGYGGDMQLYDGMKNVIRALAYFEYGAQDIMSRGFSELCGYHFDGNTFDDGWEKVKQIRCFKNGRVDIKFTSEQFARQFAEEYLGTTAA